MHADFVDEVARGTDNSEALQSAIDKMQKAGGGTIVLPPGFLYFKKGVTISSHGIHIRGSGKYSTFCIFEPESANQVLFNFDGATSGYTSLYICSLSHLSIEGIDPDVPGVDRHKKVAIRSVCTSEFRVAHVAVNKFSTGSAFNGEGLSIGLQYRGKELCTLHKFSPFADIPIKLEMNPYERDNVIIDSDSMDITGLYSSACPTGTNIAIDPGLVVRAFLMDGSNIMAGGLNGIMCTDGVGTQDWTQFTVKNLRIEQLTPGGFNIRLERSGGGKLYGVQFENVNLCINSVGVKTRGIITMGADNVDFYRFENQGASPMAWDFYNEIGARYYLQECFVPHVGGGSSLINLGGLVVKETSNDADGSSYSQLPTRVVYGWQP